MRDIGDQRVPTRRVKAIGAAATVLTMLALGACAESSDAGDPGASTTSTTAPSEAAVTDLLGPVDQATGSPIKIGFVGDGVTPAFDNTSEFDAANAVASYWNEHNGGIHGRPVQIVTCGTQGDPATAADCANKLVQEDVTAVALSQSTVTESVWAPLHDSGIPMLLLAANGTALLEDDQSTYNLNNGNGTLFTLPVTLAEEKGIEKITFAVIDVPQAVDSSESVGPALLEQNGIDYDLVKIPIGTADMIPQMQTIAAGDSGLVHVIGNDAFCIAAFKGLHDVGYEGEVSSVAQCITEATREQSPPDILDGMHLTALTTIGASDDPGYQLYDAVMRQYSEIDEINNPVTMSAYTTASSLLTALAGLTGEATPDAANQAIKAMVESEIPGAGGMKFKCDGTASGQYPSVCSSQTLVSELDANGNPVKYTVGESLQGQN
jgi:branched-chain amino acid transport system substrate-binding protein